MPGWEPESWGYMSDDGNLLCGNSSNPKKYGPTFGNGDVIGCGINFHKGNLFFTRNGNLLSACFCHVPSIATTDTALSRSLGTAAQNIKSDRFYPAVGLKRCGDHVRVNFGQSQFVFDIDSLVAVRSDSLGPFVLFFSEETKQG